MADAIRVVLTSTEFQIGLTLGGVGLVVAIGICAIWRRSAPVTGTLWVAGASAALVVEGASSGGILLGLVLLILAGIASSRFDSFPWLGSYAAAPGAWLIAQGSPVEGPDWLSWFILGAIVVASPLTAATARRLPRLAVAILLWGISIGGLYGTVPDTEHALVLAGAVVPLILLVPLDLSSFGDGGSYAAVGLLAWATAAGGVGRPASIIGGLACLGVFLVAPLARRIRPEATESWLVVLLTHVAVVAVSSRVAGLRASAAEAGLIAAAALLLGLVVLIVAGEVRARRVTVPDSRAASS